MVNFCNFTIVNIMSKMILVADSRKTSIFSQILIFMIIFYIFIQKKRRGKILKMLEPFHTKPVTPLVGNVRFSTGSGNKKENFTKILNSMINWKFPALRWIFHIPIVIVGTPDDVQKVLTKTNDRGLLRMHRKSFGSGILLSEGEKWHKSRCITDSSFSLIMLRKYFIKFHEHSKILIKKIKPFADTNNTFDIGEYITSFNMDTTIQNTTGIELQSENTKNELLQALEEMINLDAERYWRPLLYLDFAYNFYLYFTGKEKVVERIQKIIQEIIHAKIAECKSKNNQTKNLDPEIETKTETFLGHLLNVHDSDSSFTMKHVYNELLSMVVGGSFTTSRTVAFMLLMMGTQQDVQEKAFREIESIFQNEISNIKMEDLNRLVYLEQCIKETLRKFPAIGLTFRKSSKDIQLNEKQTIPANCNIAVSIYALHHNKNFYPNPENWDPDRFAQEAITQRHKLAYLPFGVGPRSCVGAKYTMISMKTQMVHLLYNYRFTTNMKTEDLILTDDGAFKSENGYWLTIWHRRNNGHLG